jgi:hypothetical protein
MKIRSLFPCVLAAILATPLLAAETPAEHWYALYMEGGKVGHASEIRSVAPDGKVSTTQNVQLTIARGGMSLTAKTSEKSIETADGKPLGFEYVQDMGVMASKSSGKVAGGKLTITSDSAGEKSTQTIDWPAGAMMAEGIRLAGIKHGLKPGITWKATLFTASIMEPMEVLVTVGEANDIDLLGRVVRLTKVTAKMTASTGPMTQVSWVNADYETMKMTTDAMGMKIEMVACPKEFAMSEDDTVDFFSKVTVPSPEPITNIDTVKSITYHIAPAEGAKPVFPATDSQVSKTAADGNILLTVTRPAAPPAATIPYAGTDAELVKATKRSQYLESDDPCVVSLAKKAVGTEKDAWKAAKKIEKFVSSYVANKNLSVGYATAAETARSRSGDCTEHAVLVAAMCRAVGIPAQVVAGLVYAESFGDQENIFGPHAWAQVNIAGKWYGLDATGAPRGFAPDHIALAAGDGSPAAFLGITNTVGNFSIDKLDIKR